MNIPKQFERILENCSESQKARILEIHNLIVKSVGQNGVYLSTGKIQYGRVQSEVFASIRRDQRWPEPKLFLRLPIPYATCSGKQETRSELGWMSLNTEDWQSIEKIYYHPKNTKRIYYPNKLNKPQNFNRLITQDEQEVYRNQNKTPLEMAVDKALRIAGF